MIVAVMILIVLIAFWQNIKNSGVLLVLPVRSTMITTNCKQKVVVQTINQS
jgi:2-C-methyl-D-erythritol 4-phosphate cytidylyltransferase